MASKKTKRTSSKRQRPNKTSVSNGARNHTSRAIRRHNQQNLKIDETRCYIKHLPIDVLQEIFVACLPTDRNPCMAAFEAPMLLTRICSSWRRLVHSIPFLWSAIHIVLPPVRTPDFSTSTTDVPQEQAVVTKLREREPGVIEWLNRSGRRPLSISIYQSMRSILDYDSALRKWMVSTYIAFLLKTVHPHSKRWFEMDVCIHPVILAAFTGGLTGDNLPVLRSIHIDCNMHGGYRSISSERPLDVLYRLTSSNVESISFTGSEFLQDDLATLQGISWKKITTLCLEGKIDVLLSVVRHCRLLQTLKINARSYLGGMIQRYGTLQGKLNEITLPNLTSLCLLMDSSLYISELIGSLKLPSLKTLDYHLNGQSYEHVPSPIIFCDTLKRLLYHADNLESLRIHSLCCSSHDDLVQILQMTPHLRLLNFSWKHTPFHRWRDEFVALDRKPSQGGIKILNDDLLEALSPLGKQQSEIICPDLQTFECYEGMRTSFTKKAVKEFVQKRRDPNRDYRVSALRDVRVSVVSPARCESLVDFGYWESKLETGRFMPREGLQCWRDAGRPYRFLGYDIISL